MGFLTGIYGYIAAAVIAAAASGWAVHAIDNGSYQSLKAEQASQEAAAAQAALAQIQNWNKQILDAVNGYNAASSDLTGRISTIQRELRNVQAKTPLAADCKPDADRLHALQSAIAASNAAASR